MYLMKIRNLKNNKISNIHSITNAESKYDIQYTPSGKIYSYLKTNIEILNCHDDNNEQNLKESAVVSGNHYIRVFSYDEICYKCENTTQILTYVLDSNFDELQFPWDKNRLNKLKTFDAHLLHMEHEYLEFYPIQVIGSNEYLDNLMMKKFEPKIKLAWSKKQKRRYPMNHCSCGAHQGQFYIYEHLNQVIQKIIELPVVDKISLPSNYKILAHGK